MLAASTGKTSIWEYDLRTHALFSDQMLKQIYGYNPHEIEDVRANWQQQIHPDDWPMFEERLARLLKAGEGHDSIELRIMRKDQSPGWAEVSSSIICDDDGSPVRIIGTTVDITARKHAEEALSRFIDARIDF